MADKSRYFAFLVYPENPFLTGVPLGEYDPSMIPQAYARLVETLKATFGEYAISPLHEPDEENAKPHWHVIYKHSNTCTKSAAESVIPMMLPANGHLLMLHHPRVYQRYLIHLDDKQKQQFPEGRDAITLVNRFPLDLSREFSAPELRQMRMDVFDFIRDNDLVEYSDLVDALQRVSEYDLLDYACNHTILYNSYLASRREKKRTSYFIGEDGDQGEE